MNCRKNSEDTVYQYIKAPAIDMVPVRIINITVPKSILEEIDNNAKLAGMSRSGIPCCGCPGIFRLT